MFSRKDQLIKRTGEFGVGRYDFLRQLIHEYTTSTSFDSKRQTLANLANFSYDPINYEYMKQLHLADLFLAEIQNENEDLVHYALSGLCNLSCDPEIKEYVVSLNGLRLVSDLLSHRNVEISLNALTALYYLYEGLEVEATEELKGIVGEYSSSGDPRLRNLGVVFAATYLKDDSTQAVLRGGP